MNDMNINLFIGDQFAPLEEDSYVALASFILNCLTTTWGC